MAALLSVTQAAPESLTLDNGDFEVPKPLTSGDWQNFAPGEAAGGWVFYGEGGQIVERSGNQLAAFWFDAGIWQDLAPTIAAGDVYRVTLDLGPSYGPGNPFGYVTVGIMDSVSGTVLASWQSTEHPTALTTYSFDLTIPENPTGAGNAARLFIAAPATQQLAGGTRQGVDNVSVQFAAAGGEYYTVSFDSNGGSAVDDQSVPSGDTAMEPSPGPTLSGFTFAGWYSDAGLTTLFDFENTTITEDTVLYAAWTINTYTLTYHAGAGGSIDGATPQSVTYFDNGAPVTAVPDAGWWFVKWSDNSTDNPRTDIFVDADITVTAIFQQPRGAIEVLTIANAGFETPADLANGDWQNFAPGDNAGGWVFYGEGGQIVERSGNQLAAFWYDAGVHQDLNYEDATPVLLAAGDVYTVTLDLGPSYGPGNPFGIIEVGIMDSVSGTVLASWTSTETPEALTEYTFDLTMPDESTGLGGTARLYIYAPPGNQYNGSRQGVDNVSVVLVSGGSAGNYASWADANDITGGPDAVGPDGITNLLLYALDLKLDGTNGSPGTLGGSGGRTVTFPKRSDAVANGDVTYAIETSTDLQTWDPVTPDADTSAAISYTLPDHMGAIFARLKVAWK